MRVAKAIFLLALFVGVIGFPAAETLAALKKKKVVSTVSSLHRQRSRALSHAPNFVAHVRSLREPAKVTGPVRTSISSSSRMGLTLDECETPSDCIGGRVCVDQENEVCSSKKGCTCIPRELRACSENSECVAGEVCFASRFCVSEEVTSLPTIPDRPPGTGDGTGDGLTGDQCSVEADCQGTRDCIGTSGSECTEGMMCFCLPSSPEFCENKADCDEGEQCFGAPPTKVCVSETVIENLPPPSPSASPAASAIPIPSLAPGETPPVVPDEPDAPTETPGAATTTPDPAAPEPSAAASSSPETIPGTDGESGPAETPTVGGDLPGESPDTSDVETTSPAGEASGGDGEDDDEICIDARALSHLPPEELVYERHNRAKVLCDSNESCATPGHIVVYEGTAMRMSSYCAIVGCEKRSMLVNSPRYKRALRVASNSDGLHYTAFAARYDTRAEEAVLTTAVHMGL